ncbi:hypothetical protein D3C71_1902630 [compost metagenome]
MEKLQDPFVMAKLLQRRNAAVAEPAIAVADQRPERRLVEGIADKRCHYPPGQFVEGQPRPAGNFLWAEGRHRGRHV